MNYKDAAPLVLESGAAAHAVQDLAENTTRLPSECWNLVQIRERSALQIRASAPWR
jgi:hypothetical protein